MQSSRTPPDAPSTQSWRGLFLTSGIGSIAFVILLLVALTLDWLAPPPVDGGVETLEFIAANKGSYIVEQILWILPGALAALVFLALYVVLRSAGQSLALIASTLGGLSWALSLAVPVTSRGSLTLVYLSDQYVTASQLNRHIFSTAAEAIIAENNTPALVGPLSAVGILLISIVMLKGIFPRILAWLGILTGTLGVVSEVLRYEVPGYYLAYGILLWVWFIAIGIALIRLSARTG